MSENQSPDNPKEIRESPGSYARATEVPTFFGKPMYQGELSGVQTESYHPSSPVLFYKHPNGKIWAGDSLVWLKSIESESVDLVFADPPYNIKKAEWDTFESQEAYVAWSLQWIEQVARILKPTGSLYVCGFSEILADIKLPTQRYFEGCRWIVWHYKNKANMGTDWGRSHESILHFRKNRAFTFNMDDVRIPYGDHTTKYPEHPQAETSQYGNGKPQIWQPNPKGAKPRDVIEVPVTNNGMQEKNPPPHPKTRRTVTKNRFGLVQSRRAGARSISWLRHNRRRCRTIETKMVGM